MTDDDLAEALRDAMPRSSPAKIQEALAWMSKHMNPQERVRFYTQLKAGILPGAAQMPGTAQSTECPERAEQSRAERTDSRVVGRRAGSM